MKSVIRFMSLVLLISLVGCGNDGSGNNTIQLLNVSYDPTRELYRDINEKFAAQWLASSGQVVSVKQSHGGSGSQARSVMEGLDADVVTLALAYDIDAIHLKAKRLGADWQTRLPNNSAPYTSTIVFLVRKGNPKNIQGWEDLVRDGVQVVTPNPKTSGGARWNYLAAWGYVLHREFKGDWTLLSNPAVNDPAQLKAQQFVTSLYKHAPVLDRAARDATNSFARRNIGDVLVSWENEAMLAMNELGKDKFELIVPPVSILAEPPVALVDTVVDRKGTRKVAEAYLNFLYTDQGQQIIAQHHFRPHAASVLEAHRDHFPALQLFSVDQVFGGWQQAQAKHFADGGVFDSIYANP